jgi:hypothetical protein
MYPHAYCICIVVDLSDATTTIRISKSLSDKLAELGSKKETYEAIMEPGNSTCKSLAPFEECCGDFLDYRVCDGGIAVRVRQEYSIALPFSPELSRILRDFKPGDRIGILRVDDDTDPIKVRRVL